jgi:hypothetical protein
MGRYVAVVIFVMPNAPDSIPIRNGKRDGIFCGEQRPRPRFSFLTQIGML